MKQIALKLLFAAAVMALAVQAHAWTSTQDLGTPDPLNPDDNRTPYSLTTDLTLDNNTLYTLHGFYYVEPGYTLTIPAGTVIQGTPAATLIIKPGATIMAEGTPESPIIFTSNRVPGDRLPGDWGGVIILGYAEDNEAAPVIEGGIIDGSYGGQDDDDSSGVFKYVRIEFPGYRFQLDNEINGLTMGGVGRGTELHHVQVSYSFDDSFEWFGGTVNAHHLVAMGGTDDEFDTDHGYRGELQFVYGIRDPEFSDPTGSSNGFESDNDGSGSNAWPQTKPIFSNVTMVGPEYVGASVPGNTFANSGVLRRNSRISCFNSVIAGYPRGMSVRENSIVKAGEDTLQFHNNEVSGNYEYSTGNIHDTGRWAGVGTWFMSHANLDTVPRSHTVVGLTGPDQAGVTAFNPVPAAGSVLIGTADFTEPALQTANFTPVTYRGAFDPALPFGQQWTAGWTNFDPQNTDYAAVSAVGDDTPTLRASASNYPNPFNPSTTISFSVPRTGHVNVTVYNVRGQVVAVVHDGELSADTHSVEFQGNDLSSGTYFYRVTGDGFSVTEKMQLVK